MALKLVALMLLAVTCAVAQEAADDSFLSKQEAILKLLTRLQEPNADGEQATISRSYNPGSFQDRYKKPELVSQFIDAFSSGNLLKRAVYFSLFQDDHRAQMIDLYQLFANADTWETFYNTACWARDRMNERLFAYALSVAVLNRDDCKGIILPPPYEVSPHYFVPTVVVNNAYRGRMKGANQTVAYSFTGTAKNAEQKVAYFGEDVELNSHHQYWHMEFPFWWNEQHGSTQDRKGELFFYMHHQLIARFDAERLSNGLPPVKALSWNDRVEEGFAPMTSYRKEGDFPTRPDNSKFSDLNFLTLEQMRNYEDRIHKAIDADRMAIPDGSQIPLSIDLLGDLMEASEYSLNPAYYGSLHNNAHMLISRMNDPSGKYGMPPGVMEHFDTATRDPAFFKLHKYMDRIFKKYKDGQSPYGADDLSFEGVSVDSVSVRSSSRAVPTNQLITYFEDYEFSIDNALDVNPVNENLASKARVSRLVHEPFNFKIDVTSDAEKIATVRVFLVPKFNSFDQELNQDDKRWSQIELDKFVVQLNEGKNTIQRSSKDSSVTVPDRKRFAELLQDIQDARNGVKQMIVNKTHRHCGLPEKLLIPRGSTLGTQFELFVMLTDWNQDKVQYNDFNEEFGGSVVYCGAQGRRYPDRRPMGFPFDKSAEESAFQVSNLKVQDITIKFIPNDF